MTHKILEFNCSTGQSVFRDATPEEIALRKRDIQEDEQHKAEQQVKLKDKTALVKKAAKAMGLTAAEYLVLFPVIDIKDVE